MLILVKKSIAGNSVLQTFIITNDDALAPMYNHTNNNLAVDNLSTVVEYNTNNVNDFISNTSGSIYLELYDVTDNLILTSTTIPLNEIATTWNTLAEGGSTIGNTIFRQETLPSMVSITSTITSGNTFIWQILGNTSDDTFNIRLNGLQKPIYQIITS